MVEGQKSSRSLASSLGKAGDDVDNQSGSSVIVGLAMESRIIRCSTQDN
jgi:hypothetical protein